MFQGICLFVQNALQFTAHALALGDHLCPVRRQVPIRAARFAAHVDGVDEVLHFEMDFSAFHTSQNTMASTFTGTVSRVSRGFRHGQQPHFAPDRVGAQRFHDGDNVEDSRATQADITASRAQDGTTFHRTTLTGEQEIDAQHSARDDPRGMMNGGGDHRAANEQMTNNDLPMPLI